MASLLTIAGTDPSGGAGIPVDLQVFRDFGYHGLSVVTAVVAQNTTGVRSFEPVDGTHIADQIDAVLDDIPVGAVKIGMLATAAAVRSVAASLSGIDAATPVVYDPVLASGGGDARLERAGMVEALGDGLLERVDWLTPNIPEAETLLDVSIDRPAEMERAAVELLELGPSAILLKVGHLSKEGAEMSDLLALRGEGREPQVTWLTPLQRIPEDVRGTGCQLSSALAAALADGDHGGPAAERARRYLNDLLHHRRRTIGRGRPVIVRASLE